MLHLKHFSVSGSQHTLNIQKNYLIVMGVFAIVLALTCFWLAKADRAIIMVGIMFLLLATLILLRTTAKTVIDTAAKTVSHQPFFFSKPSIFKIDEIEGFNSLEQFSGGIKGSTIVGLTFLKNGKRKTINLRQGFMSTKGLKEVVEETRYIISQAR